MKDIKQITHKVLLLSLGLTILAVAAVHAQGTSPPAGESSFQQEKMMVIETDLGADQFVSDTDIVEDVFPLDEASDKTKAPIMESSAPALSIKKIELKDDQFIQANRSLKRVIEENKKLIEQNKGLDDQLRNLRGQRSLEVGRLNAMTAERDSYKEQVIRVEDIKSQIEKNVVDFQVKQVEKEDALKARIKQLEDELVKSQEVIDHLQMEESLAPEVLDSHQRTAKAVLTPQKIEEERKKNEKLVEMIGNLRDEKRQLKIDEARIHYNMGNAYFQKGAYELAVLEYKKAVALVPEDANAHFNLAYVSGDFLDDLKTAAIHYEKYLLLSPDAEDANLVKEKILEAKLYLRTTIDSVLEKDMSKRDFLTR